MFLTGPLEQFQLLKFFNLSFTSKLNLTLLSNFTEFFSIFLVIFFLFISLGNLKVRTNSASMFVIKKISSTLIQLIDDNAKKVGFHFYVYFLTLFLFLLYSNLVGLIPVNFTLTSHIIITLSLSLTFFITINIYSIVHNKYEFLNLFLPGGTPFLVQFMIVPIEIISYLSRIFSLAIRLFANMMAGHSLLQILISFVFIAFTVLPLALNVFLSLPLVIISIIIFMELGIALLQVYVFLILSLLYLSSATNVNNH